MLNWSEHHRWIRKTLSPSMHEYEYKAYGQAPWPDFQLMASILQ
jgi:hypothetical protein